MGKLRQLPLLTLLALAVPTFLLLMSLTAAPAVEGQPVATSTRTATPFPSFFTKIIKTLVDPIPVATGQIVTFRVTIQTGRDLEDVIVQDILAGLGQEGTPGSTEYVANSATLSPPNGPITAVREVNQLNRIVYNFHLGDLDAGTYILEYQFRIGDLATLGCFRNATNEAHLRIEGRGGNLSTSTIGFPVRGPQEFCLTATPTGTRGIITSTPSTPSPTNTPVTPTVTNTPITPTLTPTLTRTATATAPPGFRVDKEPQNVTTGRNATINYTVTINLGSAVDSFVIEDIISGLGRLEGLDGDGNITNQAAFDASTHIVQGSAFFGPLGGPLVAIADAAYHDENDPVKVITNQLNRIVYHFVFGATPAGTYELRYQINIADAAGCFAEGHNQVHLYVNNFQGHPGQDTVGISVRCG